MRNVAAVMGRISQRLTGFYRERGIVEMIIIENGIDKIMIF
jgi:hypothetical protein